MCLCFTETFTIWCAARAPKAKIDIAASASFSRRKYSAPGKWFCDTIWAAVFALAPVPMQNDCDRWRKRLAGQWGEPANWPRDPEKNLLMLENLIERNLLEEASDSQEHRDYFRVCPVLGSAGDLDSLARGAGSKTGAIS